MSMSPKYWKLIAAIAAFIALLAFLWLIHHHGYNAGRDHVRAQWAAEKAVLAEAVEKDRARRQAESDARDERNARRIQELLAENEKNNEVLNDAVQKDHSPCDRIGDDVVRAHNAKISAAAR